MWFLYVLGIVIVLVVDYIVANKFAEIAEMKGHEASTYFWFTFLLGIVGMLMVVALPEVSTAKATRLSPLSTQSAEVLKKAAMHTQKDTVKRCPYCGDVVRMGRCEMCGKEVQ